MNNARNTMSTVAIQLGLKMYLELQTLPGPVAVK